jgi:chromosome segregation ATPase
MTQAMIDEIKKHMSNLEKQIAKENILVAEEMHKHVHLVFEIKALKKQQEELRVLESEMNKIENRYHDVTARKDQLERKTEEFNKEVDSLKEENENIYSQLMSLKF